MAKGELSNSSLFLERTQHASAVSIIGNAVILRLPPLMKPADLAERSRLFLDALARGGNKLAVVDGSEVETMDAEDAEALRKLMVAVSLIGVQPCLSGLRPGVAAVLASMDPRWLRGVRILRDLEDAMESTRNPRIPASPKPRPQPAPSQPPVRLVLKKR